MFEGKYSQIRYIFVLALNDVVSYIITVWVSNAKGDDVCDVTPSGRLTVISLNMGYE